MYLEYYGLKESPFSITPDPRYVYLSERHRDALAHLLYGVGKGGSGGFVQLTGEVGTGKTTLCRLLLEQLPEHTRVALLLNPKLSPVELLETLCEELKLDITGKRSSLKGLVDTLNAYLLDAYAQGLRVVLIIDEAQNLSIESLEQVRLLTNLETPTQKLLQIILLGQPELREVLAKPELRQLAQRITARYHLTPLNNSETETYVRHRMMVAGCARLPFTRLGLRALYQRSSGIPRLVNVIADRALMAGFAREEEMIGERLVDRAADEALPGHARYWVRRYGVFAALGALILLAAVLIVYLSDHEPAPVVATPAVPPVITPAPDSATQHLRERLAQTPESELNAWTQLLARWQVNSVDVAVKDAIRCQSVVFPGLNCLHGHGSLEQLLRFDRPLILVLENEGRRSYALLLGADKHRVRLDFAAEQLEIERESLTQFWTGEFLAVWRLPPQIPLAIHKGDAGASVAWVKERLATLDSTAVSTLGPAFFDTMVEERIRTLQLAYGITADGIVGPETLFALSALDTSGPHLSRNVD